jgi:hypothetical protein
MLAIFFNTSILKIQRIFFFYLANMFVNFDEIIIHRQKEEINEKTEQMKNVIWKIK